MPSAVVHLIDGGVATPTTTPPQPHERGVAGAPTLVQNVETLAHAALVARGGDAGSVLITVAGGVKSPRVLEVERSSTIAQVIELAGGLSEPAEAVLLGGYFGAWVQADKAWPLPIDPT